MIELLGKSLEELQSIFKTHNIQKFRAKQLIDYIYHRYIFDFEDMTYCCLPDGSFHPAATVKMKMPV